MATPQVVNSLIGKDVVDSDNHVVGRVLGVINDAEGAAQVGIEFINGDFLTYPMSQIVIADKGILIKHDYNTDSENLIRDFRSINKKIAALDKLYQNNEIPNEVYTVIHERYESVLARILDQQKSMVSLLDDRIKALNNQIFSLRSFIAQTRVEYMVGELDEQSYKISSSALQARLNKILPEKGKLVALVNGISAAFKENKPIFESSVSVTVPSPTISLKLRDTEAQTGGT